MADYYEQSVVNPSEIPVGLVTGKEIAVLEACGFKVEKYGKDENATYYVFAEESTNPEPDLSEIGLTEEETAHYAGSEPWITVLQDILRKSNESGGKPIGYFTVETGCTASKMLPDGYGGHAMFVTADNVEYFGTGMWLADQTEKFETNGKRTCPGCASENGYKETICHECGEPFSGTKKEE